MDHDWEPGLIIPFEDERAAMVNEWDPLNQEYGALSHRHIPAEVHAVDETVTRARRQFTVVMRGPSAVFFQQGDSLLIQKCSSAVGPVSVLYTSRWVEQGQGVTIPGHLSVQIQGEGPTLDEVLAPFCDAGLGPLPFLSLSANAAIGEPELELGFDSTPGVTQREFFQSCLPSESSIVHSARCINVAATVALLEALVTHCDSECLRRAASQYWLALRAWRLGREALSLAHLWMAAEALTPVVVRAECARRGGVDERQLAHDLGIQLDRLQPELRRRLILREDDECYKKAKEASDGFEHGFLQYDRIRELAGDVRYRMAGYVRAAILDACRVSSESLAFLTTAPFDKPIGHWPLVKYARGWLMGMGDQVAAEGSPYPFLKWEPAVKTFQVAEDGKLRVTFNEQFSPQLRKGISLKLELLEVWRPD